jgi:hypothetical protein
MTPENNLCYNIDLAVTNHHSIFPELENQKFEKYLPDHFRTIFFKIELEENSFNETEY